MEAYRAALAGQTLPLAIGASRTKAGSIAALIVAYYGSSVQFRSLGASTQRAYRNILERFRREHGDKPVALLTHNHINAMLADKVKTPTAANHWLRQVKWLMEFAIDQGFRKDNPAARIKNVSNRTDGFHTWTEDEITQFEAHHAVGSKARLALALLVNTGQRRSDVVRMGRQHVKNGSIHVRQLKTGTELDIKLHPDLVAIIEATPSEHLTFLTTAFGKPFTAAGFGNWFRERCNEAGLPKHCSAHGLRKGAARRMAEAGCSANVIAAVLGHKTLTEVSRYTRAADQARLAQIGIKAITRTKIRNRQ